MQNKLILLTGPSGVGKTTIANFLLEKISELERLVTFTTRKPRPTEKDGIDYYFINEQEFQNKIKDHDFFEYAKVYGKFYGNSHQELKKIWDKEKAALLVVDIQGVKTIENIIPEATSIFIKPDTMENLKSRILRRPMSKEQFQKRWQMAEKEMQQTDVCDHTIVNAENQQDKAVADVRKIIKK